MKILKDKVVLVTGAGSGIGRALALELASHGSIIALNDINDNYLQKVQEEIEQKGGQSSKHVADIGSRKEVETLVEQVMAIHGQLDVLINNAGVSLARMSAHKISWEQWEWIMKINFWGTLHCTKLCYPFLSNRPEAHIVNISSVFSLRGVADRSAYCASKFAVRGLTESLIQETRGTSIKVTSVLPGGVSTNIVKHCKGWDSQLLQKELIERHQKMSTTTPERAAKVIIKGIQRNKKRVLIGNDAYFMDFIVRYFRYIQDWLFELIVLRPEKRRMQQLKLKEITRKDKKELSTVSESLG